MDNTRLRNADQRSAALRIVLGFVVLASLAVCIWRGPYRGASNPSDFILIYGPTRAWLTGGNAYDPAQAERAWVEAGGVARPGTRIDEGLLYPPSTLPVLAPFAALRWPLAHRVWLAANVGFLALSLWCIALIAGFKLRQRRTWVFVAAAMLFAPVHTTLHHGQTPLYVMALMLPAFVIASRSASGLLLGLASAMKPQLGLPALALESVRSRWRSLTIGVVVFTAMLVGGALPMMLRDMPWMTGWRSTLDACFTTGAASFSAANTRRHHMVNLQYPVIALTEHETVAVVAPLVICGLLAAMFFLPPRKRTAETPLALSLSMVAVLSLMVAYHRFYDGVLLLVPLAWAISRVANRDRVAPACCTLALLLPFFLNSATALKWLQNSNRLPTWLVESWWWEHLLLPHQGWALLLMAMCLPVAQRGGGAREGAAARPLQGG